MKLTALSRFSFALALVLLIPACATPPQSSTRKSGAVQLTQIGDFVRVEINGQLFTEYHTNAANPYCYPLNGPGGLALTRSWPLQDFPYEEHDHMHHRSFWYAHGAMNGVDFWTEKPGAGRIVHRAYDEMKSGNVGVLKTRNDWIAPDGKVICTDERTLRFSSASERERILDFDITIHASNGQLTLGDTKEAAMSVRMAESMRVTKQTPKGQSPIPGDGQIITSEGIRNQDAWGKRGAWCDYSGPVNGQMLGIALFDHPSNPHHPTWWMVRDYGLLAANPTGQHAFENTTDPHAGDIVVPTGKSITFRYRFYLHAGDVKQACVAERYEEYRKAK